DRGHGQGGGDTEDARELHGLLRNARKFSGKSGGAACARKARIIPSPAGKGQLKRTATGSGLVRAAASGHAGARRSSAGVPLVAPSPRQGPFQTMSNPLARAKYLTSVHQLRQLPPDEGREVAFAGRSNAGKSSALNARPEERRGGKER